MRRSLKTAARVGTGVVALAALGITAGAAMATHPAAGGSSGNGSGSKANSVRVMTWNMCANTDPEKSKLCPNGRNTDKITEALEERINGTRNLNAVFLQEMCSADIDRLGTMGELKGWHWKFSPVTDKGSGSKKGPKLKKRPCAGNGRGYFGEAVGVKADDAKFTEHPYAIKNVPNARDHWKHWNVRASAVCADALGTRFCSTHLTPWNGGHDPDHPRSEFLTSQNGEAKELAALGKGRKQVVMGGDLNSRPTDTFQWQGKTVDMLGPLYDGYRECSQSAAGGPRTGTPTFQEMKDGKLVRKKKLDYVFTNRSAQKTSCTVSKERFPLSDHVPVTAEITF